MNLEPPPDRRRFAQPRDEIDYVYHKLVYWFYERHDRPRARRFADRLERLLRPYAAEPEQILAEECWSLIHELRGDLEKAISHREKEIGLIRKLHQLARNTPCEGHVFNRYGISDLSDRLDLLAVLYHDHGDLDKAISTLQESQQLCNQHGTDFDGEDVLTQYQAEHIALCNGSGDNGRTSSRSN